MTTNRLPQDHTAPYTFFTQVAKPPHQATQGQRPTKDTLNPKARRVSGASKDGQRDSIEQKRNDEHPRTRSPTLFNNKAPTGQNVPFMFFTQISGFEKNAPKGRSLIIHKERPEIPSRTRDHFEESRVDVQSSRPHATKQTATRSPSPLMATAPFNLFSKVNSTIQTDRTATQISNPQQSYQRNANVVDNRTHREQRSRADSEVKGRRVFEGSNLFPSQTSQGISSQPTKNGISFWNDAPYRVNERSQSAYRDVRRDDRVGFNQSATQTFSRKNTPAYQGLSDYQKPYDDSLLAGAPQLTEREILEGYDYALARGRKRK